MTGQLLCAGGSKHGAATNSYLMLDDRSFGRAWEKCDLELMLTRESLDSCSYLLEVKIRGGDVLVQTLKLSSYDE